MKKIVLLSCGKTKLDRRAEAGAMYTGDLFKKSLAYARRKEKPDRIFILSAKHGLLRMDKEIDPYDMTLNNMGKAARRLWADNVLRKLRACTDLENDHFVFLAGEKYREFLVPHMRHYCILMKGMRNGKQKAWLKNQLNQPDQSTEPDQ